MICVEVIKGERILHGVSMIDDDVTMSASSPALTAARGGDQLLAGASTYSTYLDHTNPSFTDFACSARSHL